MSIHCRLTCLIVLFFCSHPANVHLSYPVIYLVVAVWGCVNIREGLEPVNLLVTGSYAIKHYRSMATYYWKYGSEVQVVFNNAPDLGDYEQRQKFLDLINVSRPAIHAHGVRV
jgi:hypothetical protein